MADWKDYRRMELDGCSQINIIQKYVSLGYPDLDNKEHIAKVRELYYANLEEIATVGVAEILKRSELEDAV